MATSSHTKQMRKPKDHTMEEIIGRDLMASSRHIKQMEISRLTKDQTKEKVISRNKIDCSSQIKQEEIIRSTTKEVIMDKSCSKEDKSAKDRTETLN